MMHFCLFHLLWRLKPGPKILVCLARSTWVSESHFQNQPVFKKDILTISDRQFGERVGIYRLLDIFEKHGIKTTVFLNGRTVERLPELCKEIDKIGHELASESYIHDYSYMKTLEEEKLDLHRNVQAFKNIIGKPPLGYLSMGERPSENTPQLASEEGYTYWVDPQHEDSRTPYK